MGDTPVTQLDSEIEHDARSKRKTAKEVTPLELRACDLIKRCGGVVGVEKNGVPYLESNQQIGAGRLRRLVAHGFLKPSGDGLLPDFTQTFYLAKDHRNEQPQPS